MYHIARFLWLRLALHYVMLCHAILSYLALYDTTLCCAMLCYVVLCCVMVYYVVIRVSIFGVMLCKGYHLGF